MTHGLTSYHAKYYAHDLSRRAPEGVDRLSTALFDSSVDLNPHQIEAALFALESPLSGGAILADEVGLGKTIEAGIVLCQYWAERRRRLLVICPASLRKQWQMELEEKFALPARIVDAKAVRESTAAGEDPLGPGAIVIVSVSYAARLADRIRETEWDLVVIDEAHKLRNAYRPSNKTGQAIRWATQERRTLLLTATPLQNSLLELYGLSTLIDERLFGDADAFRSLYMSAGGDLNALRRRISSFCKRTLRNQVTEYVRYTDRHAMTVPFTPSADEVTLYDQVSAFLDRSDSYALPEKRRHLTALIVRKLLASSPVAIAGTLDALHARLVAMREGNEGRTAIDIAEMLIANGEIEAELLDELFENPDEDTEPTGAAPTPLDRRKLDEEISELQRIASHARTIQHDAKAAALLVALARGFERMAALGAARKALIFTESRRTQAYLAEYLKANGYSGRIVLFNGTNSGPEVGAVYDSWLAHNAPLGRASGSRPVDVRTALIEHFRDEADIMIATEAGAEGVNLQFCSLVINYDLPWNPQRIEQRIGRCHRYGQQHDVVVVNFLNENNDVDRRVLQLLAEKFRLFDGVFGASDEVLGTIESGVDIEQRIFEIYEQCRTAEQIDSAFAALQSELDEQIAHRMADARRTLLEHFDEDVHERLRLRLADTQAHLDRISQRFWDLSCLVLNGFASFDERALAFDLTLRPFAGAQLGRYHLISKSEPAPDHHASEAHDTFLYRLSHPLGEWAIERGRAIETPPARLRFDVSSHQAHVSAVEHLKGMSGWLTLRRLSIDSYEREEHLLFSMLDDDGHSIDAEVAQKLFGIGARTAEEAPPPAHVSERLAAEARRFEEATISRSLEINGKHLNEARERLEQWADDKTLAAEKALKDTKERIKALRRQSRQAPTLAEQHTIQESVARLERQQRRQRAEIFDVEDEIIAERDRLIAGLEAGLSQRTASEELFTIAWEVR